MNKPDFKNPLIALAVAALLNGTPAHAQRIEKLSEQAEKVVAQVTEIVTGKGDTNALMYSEKPVALLQVFDQRVLVRETASSQAKAIGELFKGQMIDAFEQNGNWFRIRIQDSLLGTTTGWVQQSQGQYNDTALGVFPAREVSSDALAQKGNSAQRPSTSATKGPREGIDRLIPGRDAPAALPQDIATPIVDPSQVAPPQANLPRETISVPDRWRIMQSLGFKFPLYDPYNQNPLKGDLPVLQDYLGPNWFFNLGVIADTLLEERQFSVPVPPGTSTPGNANNAGIFGVGDQTIFAHNLIVNFSLTKGNTTFRP
ncbi:MAG: SH3 domain-containing protein, partial [Limnobacter sp.]|nr:SH3 domain-containing protein [Limnobacter sp.]